MRVVVGLVVLVGALLLVGCVGAGVPVDGPPDLLPACGGEGQSCCRERVLVVAGRECAAGICIEVDRSTDKDACVTGQR